MRGAKLFCLSLVGAALAGSAGAPRVSAMNLPAFLGVWHQARLECAGAEPMRELIFRTDGRFSATWRPFGDYRDYWGVWSYDDGSGVLTLSVDGANDEPGDRVLSGRVSADAHELNLGGISFGSPEPGPRCTAPFRR